MTKRRRERDRPKAAPDALYNPNKRVLLSYESDEEVEEEEEAPGTGNAGALDDYQIAPYPETEDVTSTPGGAPSAKGEKQHEREDDGKAQNKDGATLGNKAALWTRPTYRNDATGQFPALGSIAFQFETDEEVHDDYMSEEEEAMAYLRAVRSERQNIPPLLSAPRAETPVEGEDDTRGFIDDGAYVARPSLGPEMPPDAKTTIDPQDAFLTALETRFLKQRESLHVPASADAIAALDHKYSNSYYPNNRNMEAHWLRLFRTTLPQPAQIRSMQQRAVFGLLGLIAKRCLLRESHITSKLSAWIWALLARLNDVGTMDGNAVHEIRELAKRAVLMQLSFDDPVAAELLENAAAEDDGESTPPADMKTATNDGVKQQAGVGLENTTCEPGVPEDLTAPTTGNNDLQNTFATLDSMILIIGDIFGQRDLLEFRRPWTTPDRDRARTRTSSE